MNNLREGDYEGCHGNYSSLCWGGSSDGQMPVLQACGPQLDSSFPCATAECDDTYLELLVLQRWRQDHHGVLNAEHQDNTRDSNSKIKVTDSNYPLVN